MQKRKIKKIHFEDVCRYYKNVKGTCGILITAPFYLALLGIGAILRKWKS